MPLKSKHLMPDGLDFSIDVMKKHPCVNSVTIKEKNCYYAIIEVIRREMYSDLHIYVADVYMLTANDVYEIIESYPEINGIVVISNWDHYTPAAKIEARINQIGVFTLKEFREALNYCGERFLDYGVTN